MDCGGGWHVANCRGASCTCQAITNPMMRLRFRPIAPKPVAGGDFHAGILPEKASALSTSKRVKRKYVRVRKDDKNPRKRRNSDGSSERIGESVTAKLQLMPGRSDGCASPESLGSSFALCGAANRREGNGGEPDQTAVVESWVTVEEHVKDTCMDARGLGCTDEERVRNLESDTCPGFVSDCSLSRVEWVNEAYRRMVAAGRGGGGRWPEMVVRLSAASKFVGFCTDGPGFFTCRVRFQYYVNNNNTMEKYWKIMPCDVWRLDCGGFAWRLDVKAALSLGL